MVLDMKVLFFISSTWFSTLNTCPHCRFTVGNHIDSGNLNALLVLSDNFSPRKIRAYTILVLIATAYYGDNELLCLLQQKWRPTTEYDVYYDSVGGLEE